MIQAAAAIEIIRAQQKDAYHSHFLFEQIQSIYSSIKHRLHWFEIDKDVLQLVSQLVYYLSTLWMTGETLGEEYSRLYEVHDHEKPLTNKKRLYLSILESISLMYLQKFLRSCLKFLSRYTPSRIDAQLTHFLFQVIDVWIPFLFRIHLALFFFNGKYMSFARRLLKIRLYKQSDDEKPSLSSTSWPFKSIAILLLLQTFFSTFKNQIPWKRWMSTQKKIQPKKEVMLWKQLLPFLKKESSQVTSHNKCPLCFSTPLTHPTIATCGHLYCWECILKWCSTNPACPLCRTVCYPQQLLPLYHYSPCGGDYSESDKTSTTSECSENY